MAKKPMMKKSLRYISEQSKKGDNKVSAEKLIQVEFEKMKTKRLRKEKKFSK
jgi:hypothetical protein